MSVWGIGEEGVAVLWCGCVNVVWCMWNVSVDV